MFRIGEFSKITQVSIRMLRYYDEQQILIPKKVDRETGYRLYAVEQIEELNRIILLRDMGFGVKEIKQMLASWNPEQLTTNIKLQIKRTKEEITLKQNRLRQMQGYLKDLGNEESQEPLQIIMRSLPALQVISLRKTVADYYQEGQLWKEFGDSLGTLPVTSSTPSFSIYHDIDDKEQDVDIEVCLVMEPVQLDKNSKLRCRQLDAIKMAACFHIYGPYSRISRAYKEFAFWLDKHQEYCMLGENRQICHVSACHTSNPEEYVTEMQIPLRYRD